jgi:hypothetical protein
VKPFRRQLFSCRCARHARSNTGPSSQIPSSSIFSKNMRGSLSRASAHNVFMGYQTFASNTMTALRNKGYPDCPSGGAPTSCKNNTLYGDGNVCAPQTFGDLQDGGYSKAMTHNCDTSPGHSGSPLYQYVTVNGQSIPTVAAVHIADGAVTAAIFGPDNWSRRLTPAVVTRINNFK